MKLAPAVKGSQEAGFTQPLSKKFGLPSKNTPSLRMPLARAPGFFASRF